MTKKNEEYGMIEGVDYLTCQECGANYTNDRLNADIHEKVLLCAYKCSGRPSCTLNADPKCNVHN